MRDTVLCEIESRDIQEALGLMHSTSWLIIVIFRANGKYIFSSQLVPQFDISFSLGEYGVRVGIWRF